MYPCGKGIDIYKCLYYQKMQYCCTRIGIGYSLMASWPNLCLTGLPLEAIEVMTEVKFTLQFLTLQQLPLIVPSTEIAMLKLV